LRSPALRRPAAAVLLLGVLALAGCNGGDEEDARQLLDKAFRTEIPSGDVRLDADIELEGNPALGRLSIQANGPFRNNKGKLPSTDLDVKLGTGGAQSIRLGILTTGDRAFLKFGDVFYEQPRSVVRSANESLRRGERRGGSLKRLGLDPRSWLREAKDEGDEEIAGVETTHVSGALDVERLMRDLNEFAKRSARLGAGVGPPPQPLSDETIEKVADAVKDPTFDVYVGKDDNVIRRISGRVEGEVPEEDRERIRLDRGSFSFTLELSDVGGDQRIETPTRARPISDLAAAFGAPGAGGSGTGGGTTPSPPPAQGAPDPDAYPRYAECLDRASPNDTDAIQRCERLLQ
jgi:hypothetical protein